MKNKNPHKLAAALSIIFALFLDSAFAENAPAKEESDATIFYLKQDEVKKFYDEFFSENYYKKFPEIVGKDDPNYDPDVELSLDELRKKYPLDWVEKKFGKIPAQCCKDQINPRKLKQCSGNLVCGLYSYYEEFGDADPTYYFLKEVQMKDFSEAEFKSVLVNKSDDQRARDVIKVVNDYFFNHRNLSEKNDKKMRNFMLSPKIFFTYLTNMDGSEACHFSYTKSPLKLPYAEDLIFLLTLQKSVFPHPNKNIKNYMSHGGKIYDQYKIISSERYIKVSRMKPEDGAIFIECDNGFSFEEKLKFAQNFENKFLKIKYLEDLIKTFPKNH